MGERKRGVVAIGGSAGALGALRTLVEGLSESFNGAILVVLHGAPNHESQVAEILRRSSKLPVHQAYDGEHVHPGVIYIAPPDNHMLLAQGHLYLRRGPSENGFRPAIDPLFRSVAVSASTRAIGVVLSGTLDDGASGLRALRRCGGIGIVQEFSDADYPDMPEAAHRIADPDHIVPVAAMPALLSSLVAQDAPPAVEAPEDVRVEVLISGLEEASMANEYQLGTLSPFSCPDCNGNLWQIEDGGLVRYRCHTGHAYTATSLSEHQEAELEKRLYEVLRGQRERAALLRQMADTGGVRTQEAFRRRAKLYEDDAQLIERVLRGRHVQAVEEVEEQAALSNMIDH